MRTAATFVLIALAGAPLCLGLNLGYNLYYADLHSHTGYTDGIGTPERAFTYARDTARIDILAVTDHAEGLTPAEWEDCQEQAEAATTPGVFLGLRGFEWTPNNAYGHCNVINSTDYISAFADDSIPESLYAFVAREPEAIAQMNHIATYNLRKFAYSASADSSFCLCEGQSSGYKNIYVPLDSGWHVGPSSNGDEHDGRWGAGRMLTGVWTDTLTKESVLDALRKRRTFGTQSKLAYVKFTARGAWQGSTVPNGTIQFDVVFHDDHASDRFNVVKLVTNGRTVISSMEVNSTHVEWHPTVTTQDNERRWFYVIGYQYNGTVPVWSAPIWTEGPVVSPPEYDVACVSIRAPGGSVDSGTVVTPACSVRNYGSATPGSYAVRMKIGGYSRAVTLSGPAPGTARYVTFPTWVADSTGTFAVSCSTELTADQDPSNDRKDRSATVVGSADAGVSMLLQPGASVDSGAAVTPACSVRNYGTVTPDSYTVRMKIGAYDEAVTVSGPAPGAAMYVTFPTWVANSPGNFAVSCSTELWRDRDSSNDLKTGSTTIFGDGNVGVSRLLRPAAPYDSGTVVTPACSTRNYGRQTASYEVRMKIGWFYNQSASVSDHAAGTTKYVTFTPCTLRYNGSFTVSCSTELAGDRSPSDDCKTNSILVGPRDAACVRLLTPLGTFDSGRVVTPACTVQNWCATAQNLSARMKVGNFYNKTATTSRLGYRYKGYLTFPPCTLKVSGTHAVKCSTLLANDARPANNKITGSVTVTSFPFELPQHDGVVAGKTVITPGMSIAPNPLVSGFAVLRYGLPGTGAAELSIHDVTGRLLLTRTLAAGRNGVVNLDLRHLSDGVYVVKFSSAGFARSQKLVVRR